MTRTLYRLVGACRRWVLIFRQYPGGRPIRETRLTRPSCPANPNMIDLFGERLKVIDPAIDDIVLHSPGDHRSIPILAGERPEGFLIPPS